MARARKKAKAQDDEEIAIDFQSVKKFFSNRRIWNSKTIAVGLLIVALILTLIVRVQPLDAPVAQDWARDTVYNYHRSQIAVQVDSQYPNIPQSNKDAIINREFATLLDTNRDVIEAQIAQTADNFKSRLQYEYDGKQYTYLGDLDSYYYLRFARNLEDHGNICDEVSSTGECLDTYSMAPLAIRAGSSLHVYAIVTVHKVANALGFSIPLMQASWLTPVIIGLLATLFAFLLGRKVGGNFTGFFAAIVIAMSPVFLSRSMGSDTDGWNVLMPVLIMWLFVLSFETKNLKSKLIYSGLTGFAIFLFSQVWGGWWFMFDLVIATLVIQLGYTIIQKAIQPSKEKNQKKQPWTTVFWPKEIQHTLLSLITIFVINFIFLWITGGSFAATLTNFWNAITGPLFFSTFKGATEIGGTLWPNVLTTVAEFNAASIGSIVGSIGGRMLFFLAMLGTVFLLLKPKDLGAKEWIYIIGSAIIYFILTSASGLAMNRFAWLIIMSVPVIVGIIYSLVTRRKVDIKLAIMLTLWFAGTIYASTTGLRFVLLLVPAFGIAFAYALYFIYEVIVHYAKKVTSAKPWIIKTIVIVVLLLVLYNPITKGGVVAVGYGTAHSYVPTMDDAWYDTLTNIRDKSEPDAIINSWWDFGHWFKYVADRRVTLDGGTQGFPPLHWLGKTLVTEDQDMAVGVLRMLDCGSNDAFNSLNEVIKDDVRSVAILNEIIVIQETAEAKDVLTQKYGLTAAQADDVLQYSHCSPPEDYFITSEDMVGKAGVWAHFGLWDFERAEILKLSKQLTEPQAVQAMTSNPTYNLSEDQAKQLYREVRNLASEDEENSWISPWPNYVTARPVTCTNATEDTWLCPININVASNGAQNVVIEQAQINLSNPEATTFILGFYDRTTNQRVGENTGIPQSLVVAADEGFVTTPLEGTSFPYDVLLIPAAEGYQALVSHPLLTKSTFTKLFYLDGKYMEDHYVKFSEMTDLRGERIVVWKINWEGTGSRETSQATAED